MTNFKISALALGLVIIGTGCAQGTSGGIPTEEINAQFVVSGNSSNEVNCKATFTHGSGFGGTYLELTEGDTATCSDGTTSATLSMSESILGTIDYVSSALPYDPAKTYTITFTRGSGEAFSSDIPLPDPVVIGAPAANAVVSKGSTLPVTWTAGDGHDVELSVSWSTSGHSRYFSERSADDGSYTMSGSATQVQDSNGNAISGDVSATLRLERSITVAHPSPLQGASYGRQTKSVSITLRD